MRTAVYGRVSTTDKQDVTMQTKELQAHVQARGWTLAGVYADKITGASDSRPALNQMLAEARARRIDCIVIWKLDRLFRDLRHMVNLVAELQALGVALVSVRDQIDLTTPAGKLMFHLLTAMAEFEKSLIVERVRAGVRHAREKGKVLGRPRLVIDAAQIADLRAEGYSWAEIGNEVGQTPSACRRAHERYLATLPKSPLVLEPMAAGNMAVV